MCLNQLLSFDLKSLVSLNSSLCQIFVSSALGVWHNWSEQALSAKHQSPYGRVKERELEIHGLGREMNGYYVRMWKRARKYTICVAKATGLAKVTDGWRVTKMRLKSQVISTVIWAFKKKKYMRPLNTMHNEDKLVEGLGIKQKRGSWVLLIHWHAKSESQWWISWCKFDKRFTEDLSLWTVLFVADDQQSCSTQQTRLQNTWKPTEARKGIGEMDETISVHAWISICSLPLIGKMHELIIWF